MSSDLIKSIRFLTSQTRSKLVQWAVDIDYVDKLIKRSKSKNPKRAKEAAEALIYIAKFYKEYYNNGVQKNDLKALHKTVDLRKDCYNRNNAMRRCIMSAEWRKVA